MTIFGYKPGQIRKAIAGGLVAAAPLFAADLADSHLTLPEVGGLIAAAIIGAGAVFGIRNEPGKGLQP